MNRRGASGVDGETTKEFEQGLDTRVQDLRERLKRGAYRAPPVRRVEIPKGPGKAGTRPLGIPTVEDRPATKSGRADPGSGVRGGFPGMLVWISARM